jgi:hypothetical protein
MQLCCWYIDHFDVTACSTAIELNKFNCRCDAAALHGANPWVPIKASHGRPGIWLCSSVFCWHFLVFTFDHLTVLVPLRYSNLQHLIQHTIDYWEQKVSDARQFTAWHGPMAFCSIVFTAWLNFVFGWYNSCQMKVWTVNKLSTKLDAAVEPYACSCVSGCTE